MSQTEARENGNNKSTNESKYMVIYYGDDSDDGFMVKDTESGRCQLFDKGELQMSWREENDQRVGGFTVYHMGEAVERMTCSCLFHLFCPPES